MLWTDAGGASVAESSKYDQTCWKDFFGQPAYGSGKDGK